MEICGYMLNERRDFEMPNKKVKKKKKTIKKVFNNAIVVSVTSEVVFAILVSIVGWVSGFLSLPSRVSDLEKQMAELTNDSDNSQTNPNTPIINNNIINLRPIEEGKIDITEGSGELPYLLSAPQWNSEDIIAEDIQTGEKLTAGQLVNEKIFLPYKNGNQETYFYGQFNDNNQWDGICIFNIYEEDVLVSIMEAEYDNGNFKKYKQVIESETIKGIKVWSVAKKEKKEEYNTGETWNYIYTEIIRDFTFEEASFKNIKNVNEVEESLKNSSNTPLEGYYCGNTSNGYYNHDTSKENVPACMIKYFPDGIVRTLYYGGFKDGNFEDKTGNAWYITRASDTDYMYYNGFYEKGSTKNNPECIFEEPPLTRTRIEEILEEHNCDLKLNWDSPNIDKEESE